MSSHTFNIFSDTNIREPLSISSYKNEENQHAFQPPVKANISNPVRNKPSLSLRQPLALKPVIKQTNIIKPIQSYTPKKKTEIPTVIKSSPEVDKIGQIYTNQIEDDFDVLPYKHFDKETITAILCSVMPPEISTMPKYEEEINFNEINDDSSNDSDYEKYFKINKSIFFDTKYETDLFSDTELDMSLSDLE